MPVIPELENHGGTEARSEDVSRGDAEARRSLEPAQKSERDFQLELCRDWFKDHRAEYFTEGFGIWARPSSWNYAVHYHIYRNSLICTGDLGAAVYQWSELITFEFIARTDLSYFHGKCVASEAGRNFNQWCERTLKHKIETSENVRWKKFFRKSAGCTAFHQDWVANIRDGLNENTISYDDAAEMSELGWVINSRCVGHWLGVKLALEQIKAKGAVCQ